MPTAEKDALRATRCLRPPPAGAIGGALPHTPEFIGQDEGRIVRERRQLVRAGLTFHRPLPASG